MAEVLNFPSPHMAMDRNPTAYAALHDTVIEMTDQGLPPLLMMSLLSQVAGVMAAAAYDTPDEDLHEAIRAVVWSNFLYGFFQAGGTPPEAA